MNGIASSNSNSQPLCSSLDTLESADDGGNERPTLQLCRCGGGRALIQLENQHQSFLSTFVSKAVAAFGIWIHECVIHKMYWVRLD